MKSSLLATVLLAATTSYVNAVIPTTANIEAIKKLMTALNLELSIQGELSAEGGLAGSITSETEKALIELVTKQYIPTAEWAKLTNEAKKMDGRIQQIIKNGFSVHQSGKAGAGPQ